MSAEATSPPGKSNDESKRRRWDAKTILPILAILVLVVAPIGIWAATSGGGSENKLRIDQGVSVYGEPEIVVNVPKKLNTPSETNNATSVKVIRLEGTKTKLEGELRRT